MLSAFKIETNERTCVSEWIESFTFIRKVHTWRKGLPINVSTAHVNNRIGKKEKRMEMHARTPFWMKTQNDWRFSSNTFGSKQTHYMSIILVSVIFCLNFRSNVKRSKIHWSSVSGVTWAESSPITAVQTDFQLENFSHSIRPRLHAFEHKVLHVACCHRHP